MHKIRHERNKSAAPVAAEQVDSHGSHEQEDGEHLAKLAPCASAFISLIGGFSVGTLMQRRRAELEWREQQATRWAARASWIAAGSTALSEPTASHAPVPSPANANPSPGAAGEPASTAVPAGADDHAAAPHTVAVQGVLDQDAPRPLAWALPAGLEALRVEEMTLAELEAALSREQTRRRAWLRAARGLRAAGASGRLQSLLDNLRAPAAAGSGGGTAAAVIAQGTAVPRGSSVRWGTSTRAEFGAAARDGADAPAPTATDAARLRRSTTFVPGRRASLQPSASGSPLLPPAPKPAPQPPPSPSAGGQRRASMTLSSGSLWAKARLAIGPALRPCPGDHHDDGGRKGGRRRLSSPPEA